MKKLFEKQMVFSAWLLPNKTAISSLNNLILLNPV